MEWYSSLTGTNHAPQDSECRRAGDALLFRYSPVFSPLIGLFALVAGIGWIAMHVLR